MLTAGKHYYSGHAYGIRYPAPSLQAETPNPGFQILLTKKSGFWRMRHKSGVVAPLFLDLAITALTIMRIQGTVYRDIQ